MKTRFYWNKDRWLCLTMWKRSRVIIHMMQYIKCLLMYHSVGTKSLRWPFEVLITWKRVKPGAMFFDEKLYLFHGLSYGIREICEFFASFNLTCFCCACVCQSSVILDYFKRYASSRQRGFHFVLYQKNAMKWRKIWMKKKNYKKN